MAVPTPRDNHGFFDTPPPLAIAHRGFSPEGLENSMSAFEAAIKLGYEYLETDARATKDGVVLAFHDATLDRATDRTGQISNMLYKDVAAARIRGVEPIPRLEDVLAAWPDAKVNVDAKDAATVVPLARTIDRSGAHDRICLASFSDRRRLGVLSRLSAPVASSPGTQIMTTFRAAASVLGAARAAHTRLRNVDCLQVPLRFGRVAMVSEALVSGVHAAGKQVHVWTINDEPTMHHLLDIGVDGIMTDRADVLRDVLTARGAWRTT
jgi:glycerophosphoryl diester phosphodiesterase